MRKPKDVIINGKPLDEILDLHKKWLHLEEGGVRARLSSADLKNVDLMHVDLTRANLWGSNLTEAKLWGTNLTNAVLMSSVLTHADLTNADLTNSDLSNADLSKADLTCANLTGAKFMDTNLTCATLVGTNLNGVNLQGANLTGVNMDFSSWPLEYGGLKVKIGKRIAVQLLFHLMSCVDVSDLPEFRKCLFTPELMELAKKFHRIDVDRCFLYEKEK